MGTHVAGSTTPVEARSIAPQAGGAAPSRDEAFYRALVEGMNEGVLTRDAAGVITYASPQFRRMLGYPVEELVGSRAEFLLPADQREGWQRMLAAAAGGVPQAFEHELIRKDGRTVFVSVSRRPLFDPAGVFRGSVALVSDVTEARRASLRLQEIAAATAPHTGEEFFRSVVRYLATVLELQGVFVAECADYPTTRIRILAEWDRGRFVEARESPLAGTPCEEAVRSGRISCIADNLLDRFPQYRDRERKSYLGVPVHDAAGRTVIGHIAFWGRGVISEQEIVDQPLFRIFVSRIAAELHRKRSDELLQLVAQATAPHTGEEFFESLVQSLSDALHFKMVFVTECVDFPTSRMRMLANRSAGRRGANLEYPLEGTPCEETIGNGRVSHCATGVESRFPAERGTGLDSYLGIPFFDSTGRQVIGHLAFFDDKPIDRALADDPLVRIFASRAAAELRRRRADDTMLFIAKAVAPLSGEAFFRTLIDHIVKTFGFRQAFISECLDHPPTRVRTLAYWGEEGFHDNVEFELAGLPCAVTIGERRAHFVSDRLEELYPAERGRGRVSYFGLPIFAADGRRVVGHLAFFDDKARERNVVDSPAFRILASRAGVELLRKRAEDDLRESEAKYRLLVENQTDLLVKLDREGNYLFVSPSFCECFGKEADLSGQPFDLDVNPVDREAFEQSYAAVLAPPHRGYAEARVLTSAGWRWFAWSVSGILDERGAVAEVIACGRDVTERRRAEEQAHQHLQQLAHVTRLSSMGEMATAIAHEVNQPLTAILSYTQACMRLLRSGNAPVQDVTDAMTRVAAEADRASQIIRHLRSLVRKEEAQPLRLQINFLVREVVRLVQPEARQSAVEIRTELAEDLPPVMVDNIQVQQVLLNLMRNAIEAINSAAGDRRALRVVTRHGRDNTVETCVEDSGPGFDDETAGKLFEPFFTTKAQGMGIGLAISRSIIESHQGRIWASAVPGRGASFHLTLPAVSEPNDKSRTR